MFTSIYINYHSPHHSWSPHHLTSHFSKVFHHKVKLFRHWHLRLSGKRCFSRKTNPCSDINKTYFWTVSCKNCHCDVTWQVSKRPFRYKRLSTCIWFLIQHKIMKIQTGHFLFLPLDFCFSTLKFIYSEKATKLCEISTNYLSYVLPVK